MIIRLLFKLDGLYLHGVFLHEFEKMFLEFKQLLVLIGHLFFRISWQNLQIVNQMKTHIAKRVFFLEFLDLGELAIDVVIVFQFGLEF